MTLDFKFNIGDPTVGRKGRKVEDRANIFDQKQRSKEAKQRRRMSPRVTIGGDRMMIRRPWPCQCWSGRAGGKNYPIRHSQDREGWRGDGRKKEGIRIGGLEVFVGFETGAL